VPWAGLANQARLTVVHVATLHAAAAHHVAVSVRTVRFRAALDAGAATRQATGPVGRLFALVVVHALEAEAPLRIAGEIGLFAVDVLVARNDATTADGLAALTRRAVAVQSAGDAAVQRCVAACEAKALAVAVLHALDAATRREIARQLIERARHFGAAFGDCGVRDVEVEALVT